MAYGPVSGHGCDDVYLHVLIMLGGYTDTSALM